MKTLIKKETPRYCSEVVEHNGRKFKIIANNDNSYSHLCVRVFTKTDDLVLIACEDDIPNYTRVNYMDNETKRQAMSVKNLKAAEDYIKAIWFEKQCEWEREKEHLLKDLFARLPY